MQDTIAVVTAAGLAAYVWLTIAGAPIAAAIGYSRRTGRGGGWSGAWPAALANTVFVSAIPAAALVLLMLAAPDASRALLTGPELFLGLKIGGILWAGRAAAFGIPHVSPQRETAIATAAAALRNPDAAALAMFERKYQQHMLRVEPTQRYSRNPLTPAGRQRA